MEVGQILVKKRRKKKKKTIEESKSIIVVVDEHRDTSSEWTDDSICTKCPYGGKVKVIIPYPLLAKISRLVSSLNTEWLGYLDYEQLEDKDKTVYRATGITIPDQEVTYSSVNVNDPATGIGKGVIHCHPWNGRTFHSSTDEDYVDRNHPFSIVVSKGMEFSVKAILDVPCGSKMLVDGEVEVEYPDIDTKSFLDEAKSKIKEKTYVYKYSGLKDKKHLGMTVGEYRYLDPYAYWG